jgi:RNA polymerase sigma-70 factor (ECF subfamily)
MTQADSEFGEQSREPKAACSELESLYRAHSGFVWRNARRLGCDENLADDVVHEVFLVVARRLSEFRHESSARTWLFAIAYRSVQRMLRDRARYTKRLREYADAHTSEPTVEPQAQNEAGDTLRILLGELDECQRVVFILAELEGMTSVEIGTLLGVKAPTVDSRLRAARIALGRLIAREQALQRRQLP